MATAHTDFDVTTQEAALFSNFSREYLVRLLEEGTIAYRVEGTHRRIRFVDLLQHKEHSQELSRDALQKLADQAQDLNMGY